MNFNDPTLDPLHASGVYWAQRVMYWRATAERLRTGTQTTITRRQALHRARLAEASVINVAIAAESNAWRAAKHPGALA